MSIVSIKEVKGLVSCAEDGSAAHVFNVKNSTEGSIRIGTQIAPTAPAEASWLSVEGDAERDLDPDTMTQYVVNIQVPEGCKPGKYSYRLRVFDPDNPGENYVDGESVYFEVKKKEPVVVPNGGGTDRRWILWVVAAVAVVAVIGIAVKMLTGKTEVEVPQVEESSLFSALQKINNSGLTFNAETGLFTRRVTDAGKVGVVLEQQPQAGASVPEKSEMKLWVGAMSRVTIDKLIPLQQMNKVKMMKHVAIPPSVLTRSLEPEAENE